MNISFKRAAILITLLLLFTSHLHAHAPRENYIWLNVEEDHLAGRFELNVNDLVKKLRLKIDLKSDNYLAETEDQKSLIHSYLNKNFAISDDEGVINLIFTHTGVSDEADEFIQFFFESDRQVASNPVSIVNTIFMTKDLPDWDWLHRSLILMEYNTTAGKKYGAETTFKVFSPSTSSASFDLVNPSKILYWKNFLKQGVLHIWFGLDHVLFILVLLLTTVLTAQGKRWVPASNFKKAFLNTLKIITIFTIAHSITLSLAAFGLVSLNSAFIETVIALSIIAIAVNNLFPVINAHAWILVFIFGLFHGLGFASVMADLQFRTVMLGRILAMFNIGVEIGQFVIVALMFPLFYILREKPIYRNGIVIPLSILAIVLSTYWVVERTGLIDYVV